MKTLIARSLDALLLCALYFGAYKGNPYLHNLVMPMTWLLICLAIFAAWSLTVEKVKDKFKKDRKPKSALFKTYTCIYDIVVFIALCALGYQVTGVFWAVALLIVQSSINSIDNEIKAEQKANA